VPDHDPDEENTDPTLPKPPRLPGFDARYVEFALVTADADGRDDVTVAVSALG
jgi:hypothetical protein